MADKLESETPEEWPFDDCKMEEEQDVAPMELGPEMFGLKRIGDTTAARPISKPSSTSTLMLNRRGLPARTCKKNSRFQDDFVTNMSSIVIPRLIKKEKDNFTNLDKPTSPVKSTTTKTRPSTQIVAQAVKTTERKIQAAAGAAIKKTFIPTLKTRSNIKKTKLRAKLKTSKQSEVTKSRNRIIKAAAARKAQNPETPAATQMASVPEPPEEDDFETMKSLGLRLRNLLKLPKAHKWVCHEWFYSDIDQALFGGENDFMLCLRENLPQLKSRQLTRTQWSAIRRMMGRPRRCSPAFFMEERIELARKRQKIRMIQQRKFDNLAVFRDLPDEIPLPSIIGTKITARLLEPQEGLFVGQVEAIDTSNNTYRISFEKPGLGTLSVPDYDVSSHCPGEMLSLFSLERRLQQTPSVTATNMSSIANPFCGTSSSTTPTFPLTSLGEQELLGQASFPFSLDSSVEEENPVELCTLIVKLSKALNLKKEKIAALRQLNLEAERTEAVGDPLEWNFSCRYLRVVRSLRSLNEEIDKLTEKIQSQCQQLLPVVDTAQPWSPVVVRQECEKSAKSKVEKIMNLMGGSLADTPSKVVTLITGLASLMLQIKCLAESERNVSELQALQDTLKDLRSSVNDANMAALRNHVEVHVQHIQAGLCHLGSLSSCIVSKN